MSQARLGHGDEMCLVDSCFLRLQVHVGQGVQNSTRLEVQLTCAQSVDGTLHVNGWSNFSTSNACGWNVIGVVLRSLGVGAVSIDRNSLYSDADKAVTERLPYFVQHPCQDQDDEDWFAGWGNEIEKKDGTEDEQECGHKEWAERYLPELWEGRIGIDVGILIVALRLNDAKLWQAQLLEEFVHLWASGGIGCLCLSDG